MSHHMAPVAMATSPAAMGAVPAAVTAAAASDEAQNADKKHKKNMKHKPQKNKGTCTSFQRIPISYKGQLSRSVSMSFLQQLQSKAHRFLNLPPRRGPGHSNEASIAGVNISDTIQTANVNAQSRSSHGFA
jgi:hypothetical protein